ncbi:MAG: hypothetical protein LQ338_008020 [Usnochroma carphineum]|nr:MAG: hypothetical protein LQ338_008020 [Usnochroma carphineum]
MPPNNDSSSDSAEAHLLRSPTATPHWGAQGGPAFTVRAITTINAASSTVLDVLLETSNYHIWNRFVPRVTFSDTSTARVSPAESRLQEGMLFTEHVDMYGRGKPSGLVKMKLLMTTLEEVESKNGKKYTVVWLGKAYPDWALRSERVHAISPNDDGSTTYDVWETFSGPLALLVRLFVGTTLVKRFKQWNQELKQYAEESPRFTRAAADQGLDG